MCYQLRTDRKLIEEISALKKRIPEPEKSEEECYRTVFGAECGRCRTELSYFLNRTILRQPFRTALLILFCLMPLRIVL